MPQPPAKPPQTPAKPAAPAKAVTPAPAAKPTATAAAKPVSTPPSAAKPSDARPTTAAKPAAAPPAAAKPVAGPPAAKGAQASPAAQAEAADSPETPDVLTADAKKLGLKPKHAAKFFREAVALYERNDFHGAIEAARLAVSCNQKVAQHWLIFGAGFARLAMFNHAKVAIDRAIELDPNEIGAWVSLGELQIAKKDFSAASKALQKAVELDKTGQHPASRRARMLLVARKQWASGIPQ